MSVFSGGGVRAGHFTRNVPGGVSLSDLDWLFCEKRLCVTSHLPAPVPFVPDFLMLIDKLGRTISNLRISVTDRCNFRCVYCMPEEGLRWLSRDRLLSFEEIERLVRVFSDLGIRKLRLTGGEPLVRSGLDELVQKLVRVPGIEDIALTTNGVLLAEQAEGLAQAGLKRVNVSLDSVDRETFEAMARRDALDRVLAGLEAAAQHFEGPIKLNTVLIRGVNDQEILGFAELARRPNFEVRFIEFMPLDAQQEWKLDRIVSGEEIRDVIHAKYPIRPGRQGDGRAPSQDWVFADGVGGKVGFIDSVTRPFCDHCNRIRITADGKLRTCLFSTGETDLLALVRGDVGDAQIAETIQAAVWNKEPGHKINQPDFVPASRSMSQIGG